jgi:thioesterase domain-containing protein
MTPAQSEATVFLEHELLSQIPLTRAMQLRVVDYDGSTLRLVAPLAPNVNDKGCAFGGSLASLLTLACWGLARLALRAHSMEPDIYVQDSQIEYLAPVWQEIEIVARADEGHSLAEFVAMHAARGKARITLVADVAGEAGPATTLRARFVSKRKAEEPA